MQAHQSALLHSSFIAKGQRVHNLVVLGRCTLEQVPLDFMEGGGISRDQRNLQFFNSFVLVLLADWTRLQMMPVDWKNLTRRCYVAMGYWHCRICRGDWELQASQLLLRETAGCTGTADGFKSLRRFFEAQWSSWEDFVFAASASSILEAAQALPACAVHSSLLGLSGTQKDVLQQKYITYINMAVCQNLVPLVNIKIAGKWMFHPPKNGINRY